MQLVAYGAQDIYLTGNPMITYFKVVYRRHTNFAMESIEQTFNGAVGFGKKVDALISRNGDLINGVYLQATLPNIQEASNGTAAGASETRWIDDVGHHLIEQVDVDIGGQRIDRHYGDWLEIWAQLTVPAGKMKGYREMIGQDPLDPLGQLTGLQGNVVGSAANIEAGLYSSATTAAQATIPGRTIYVPLQFWFCRNVGLSLPLIALQYHEVKINIEFRPLDECLWAVDNLGASGKKSQQAYNKSLVAASLYVDYIFLDTDERRRFAQNPHEYLIEQLQFTGDESVGSSSNKIKLNFNHPCKELVWVVQPDEHSDYCAGLDNKTPLWATLGAQPFNYTDSINALPRALHAFNSPAGASGQDAVITASGLFQDAGALDATTGASWAAPLDATVNAGVSDAGAFVLAETALHLHCWGQNPVVTAKLQLNGQDRFSEREGSYFDVVQPYQHHTRHPDTGINVYSFALRPEDHQPSGTCNFSRIDTATLQLVLSNATVGGTATAKVRVYAVNYNVFRAVAGMGGLNFSN
jgi:hypothetical protein